MQYIKLLFKRDLKESLSGFKKKKDIFGVISSVLLLAAIYGVFVYVFNHFAKMYIATDFGNVLARDNRVFELLTMCFGLVFIINVIVGVKKMHGVLTDTRDNDILIYQPISAGSIFVYKLLKVYLSQILSTILIVVPFTIVIDTLNPSIGGIGYYCAVTATVVLLPFVSCAIASLLVVPYMYMMKKISSKFAILLCMYVAIVAVGFFFYGTFLKLLSELVRSGNIKYVFDLQTINVIGDISKYLYPSRLFTDILLRNNVIINIIIIILISAIAVVISYYLIKRIYVRTIQDQLEGNGEVYSNSAKLKKRSPTATLLYKEFVVVMRTPTYAFQYFAMSITLPFMVYICASLLSSMLETLTIVNCNYALAIFVVSMLSILTNTFCTTNISRDGKMFAVLKTLPISISKIINVKVLFCSIVSFVSVLVSCLVLLITGYLNFIYFLITFIIGFLFSLVQIAYATRKDMKNPSFPKNDKEEVTEGNSNMSTLILTGLITTIIAGGGSVLLSIVIGMKYNERLASYISIGFVFIITVIALISALTYLFKGLKKEYYISDI